jgi:hypothetical protein
VPWATFPIPDDRSSELAPIGSVLDPVLTPLGFMPAQAGATGSSGQVIFCRGIIDGTTADDGCVDLVIDVSSDAEASPDWRIVDVRYWGNTCDRWHLTFERDATLDDQLSDLAATLPSQLAT